MMDLFSIKYKFRIIFYIKNQNAKFKNYIFKKI